MATEDNRERKSSDSGERELGEGSDGIMMKIIINIDIMMSVYVMVDLDDNGGVKG